MSHVGSTLIFAVAQHSFELGTNTFSTLVPISTLDGAPVLASEFPNRGLVWWLVRGNRDLTQATPGKLITGTLESSGVAGSTELDKDQFQVRADTAQVAGPPRLLEILTVANTDASEPRDLISRCRIFLDHEPSRLVLARWQGRLYGPFVADADVTDQQTRFRVRLSKPTGNRPIWVLDDDVVVGKPGHLRTEARVSWVAHPPTRGEAVRRCVYEILSWSVAEDAWSKAQSVTLVTDEEAIRRVARVVLTKAARQELQRQLDALVSTFGSSATDVIEDDRAAIQRVVRLLGDASHDVDELVRAVVQGGHTKANLDEAIRAESTKVVREKTAVLQAEAEQSISELVARREKTAKELSSIEADLQRRRRLGLAEVDKEIESKREAAERELATTSEALRAQQIELERQRSVLESNIGQVIERFKTERDRVVNDFLALQPLFESMGLLGSRVATSPPSHAPAPTDMVESPPVEPPAVLLDESGDDETVTELEFFERFRRHVEACGFRYSTMDLVAFHVSFKCADITVLGGVSGTGKSSLPRLYAQALAGSSTASKRRFLTIDVSPAWTTPSDLLGYVNVLDRRFLPSASGLFTHLVWAAIEDERKGADSGIYTVCLDELNLAQPEHYFSGLLQALSRPLGDRIVSVFDATSVAPSDPTQRWARIPVGTNVRFVGTVNFDETTRPLSQRFLDRTNVIELDAGELTALGSRASTDIGRPDGPMITSGALAEWIKEQPLIPQAVQLLSDMQVPLAKLGCPLTPRRQIAISRFLSSTPPELCSTLEALDLQIALRVLPQIKALFTSDAERALDELTEVLEGHAGRFERSMRLIEAKRHVGGLMDPSSGADS